MAMKNIFDNKSTQSAIQQIPFINQSVPSTSQPISIGLF